MNKTAIKSFAIWARNKLIADISYRAGLMGITPDGIHPALFEKTNDYTELLLNLSVVDQDGVVYHLVHDIPEEDFDVKRGGQVEIIGWLYQYYNTEPKNAAFAKKGKITKEEIRLKPAAVFHKTM